MSLLDTKQRTAALMRMSSQRIALMGIVILLCLPFQGVSEDPPEAPQEQRETGGAADANDNKEGSGPAVRLGGGGFGENPSDMQVDIDKIDDPSTQSDPTEKTKRVEFAGTPIPVVNPTVGNGLGGIGMLAVHLNPKDTESPPSVFGGGAMFTTNGTVAYGFATKLFLKKDLFRITGAIGGGNLHYDFYGPGSESGDDGLFVPLRHEAFTFLIEPKVRLAKNWYIGPRYQVVKNTLGLDRDRFEGILPPGTPLPPDPPLPERDLKLKTAALGMRLEWDTRDSQFYPYSGTLLDAIADFNQPAFGSDRASQNVEVAFQGYMGFKQKNVIAYRASVCSSSGDPAFYNLCLLGKSKDIRGYAVGRFQDRRMLVGQVEYRREMFWRVGGVAYIGAGEVAPSFSDFNTKNILTGGAVGVRFALAEQNKINIRVDYAWGRDSTAFYVGLMEVF